MVDINKLLETVSQAGASDLHLAVGNAPVARVNGELKMVQAAGALVPQDAEEVLGAVASPEQVAEFEQSKELDFSYSLPGVARFRVNASYQRGSISLSFRVLSSEIPDAKQLNLAAYLPYPGQPAKGVGAGDWGHGQRQVHHPGGHDQPHQREPELPHHHPGGPHRVRAPQQEVYGYSAGGGSRYHSFKEALRRALRQDPDVIMVGELRDLDSMSLAITAAETGHLVLGTLHTNGAAECIERIVGIFPADQQEQVQYQLSIGLAGVIFQSLMPTADGKGRVAAHEVMVGTSAIRNLIRQNQIAQIKSFMFMGSDAGMQTLEQSLAGLVQRELISREEAYTRSPDAATLDRLLGTEDGVSDPSGRLRSATQRGAPRP